MKAIRSEAPRLGAPTYILREPAAADLAGVLDRLAGLGFAGVELMGLFGRSPQRVAGLARSAGIAIIGMHVPGNLLPHPEVVIGEVAAAGARYITFEWPGQSNDPRDPGFAPALAVLAERARLALAEGLKPLFHNHDAEFMQPAVADKSDSAGGQPQAHMLDLILDQVPDIGFEPDLGWITYAGLDPAGYLRKYGDRCQIVHMKDLWTADLGAAGAKEAPGALRLHPGDSHFEFRPTGFGLVNYPALLNDILVCRPQWLVMDHDLAYNRDPYDDLALSLAYTRRLLSLHSTVATGT
jgi:sugar phosphate isomerase/epimerase